MSRIAKYPVPLPEKVEVQLRADEISVKGPLGTLTQSIAPNVKIAQLKAVRLSVHRSNSHLYAQVIDASGGKVLASASTAEKGVRGDKIMNNVKAAADVGKRIAEKAKQLGIEAVAFDRSGYRYHGRIKALAEAAREAGLKF